MSLVQLPLASGKSEYHHVGFGENISLNPVSQAPLTPGPTTLPNPRACVGNGNRSLLDLFSSVCAVNREDPLKAKGGHMRT